MPKIKLNRRRSRSDSSVNKKRGATGKSNNSISRIFRRMRRFMLRFFSSGWLLSAPVFLLLLLTSVDFLVLTASGTFSDLLFFDELGSATIDIGRDSAEALKKKLLNLVFLLVITLTTLHWKAVSAYFKQWPHISVLIGYLLFTAIFSLEPTKVITNTIIITIGFLAAYLFAFANAREERFHVFYTCVFFPMFLLHAASLYLFLLQGEGFVDFLTSTRRYGGLAGNPNSLGATAVLGYWGAICLLLSPAIGIRFKIVVAFGIALFGLHIAMSGSGTSLVSVILVTSVVVWLRVVTSLKALTRSAINVGIAFLFFSCLMLIVLFTSPAELYLTFLDALGKDATMTGRTDIWDVAKGAISEHPYRGWGFDSHASVMSTRVFFVPYNHYHNGFLDTIIAGGIALLIIVLYNLSRFSLAYRQAVARNPSLYPFILPLIMLLFLNISEYSLVRPHSQIWMVYVVSFVMLTFGAVQGMNGAPQDNEITQPVFRQKTRRKKSLRWG